MLVFFFIGKSYGKNTPPEFTKLPSDPGPNGEQLPGLSDQELENLVDKLKEDIYTFGPRNSTPWLILLGLSNTDFVRVNNAWLAKYYKLDQETLRQAAEGEFSSVFSITFQNAAPQLIARWNELNIK